MSDRLSELRRQRALLQEHLASLEREIATEAFRPEIPPDNRVAPNSKVTLPLPTLTSPPQGDGSTSADPEKTLEQYQTEPQSIHREVKRGCLLYFAVALAIVVLGVLALYLRSTK